MFSGKHILFILLTILSELNAIGNPVISTLSPTVINTSNKTSTEKFDKNDASKETVGVDQLSTTLPSNVVNAEASEVKDEVFVNDLLENLGTSDEPDSIAVDVVHGPDYELDWTFIDKDTILVTFDLYSLPKSLINYNKYSPKNKKQKLNLLGTVVSSPSGSLRKIDALSYLLFVIRPYKSHKEIVLRLEKLILKQRPTLNGTYFSNTLRLTALNHKEKYTVCICYYQKNISTYSPDFVMCQDIINDYAKFSDLKTDAKHGLLFIATQYSIIIVLLAILQGSLTIRKRRIAQIIGQHLVTKAQSIRTTLSSVSLVRQSFSTLDAAVEQQNATNGHGTQREPAIAEEQKRSGVFAPPIFISEPGSPTHQNGATASDESEPFLQRIPSRNHVHFLLGQGEPSDDDDEYLNDDYRDDIRLNRTSKQASRNGKHQEPYNDQSDALLSMAHILDTNKPWSRHDQDPPVV